MRNKTDCLLQLWFEHGLCAVVTGEQLKVLLCILEKMTYPSHRETLKDRISISQFVKATGLCRDTIISSLRVLIDANIISTGSTNHAGREYTVSTSGLNLSSLRVNATKKKTILQACRKIVKTTAPDVPVPVAMGKLSLAVDGIDRQQSMPSTSRRHRPPTHINDLAVAKNTRPVDGIDTPLTVIRATTVFNQNPDQEHCQEKILEKDFKNRCSSPTEEDQEQDHKRRAISHDEFFEFLETSKDKIATCKEVYENYDGRPSEAAMVLHDMLIYLAGAGAKDDIERSWMNYIKFSYRMDCGDVETLVKDIADSIRNGYEIKNIGALFNSKLEKKYGIKRGMAKAPAASQQKRKAA